MATHEVIEVGSDSDTEILHSDDEGESKGESKGERKREKSPPPPRSSPLKKQLKFQARNFCFTLYLKGKDPLVAITEWKFFVKKALDKAKGYDYCVAGAELCPSTGRLHMQGFIQCSKPKLASTVQKVLQDPTCHMEVARGTAQSNYDYCTKTGTKASESKCKFPGAEPFVWGEMRETEGGAPTTLEVFGAALVEGKPLKEIAQESPGTFLRYSRGAQTLAAMFSKHRDYKDPISVYVYQGVPRSGKSYDALQQAIATGKPFYKKPEGKWWDGYSGEEVVFWDDFQSHTDLPIGLFCQWLDRGPCSVPYKGGFVALRATTFIITSMFSIDCWFGPASQYSEGQLDAVAGRITELNQYRYPRPEFAKRGLKDLIPKQRGFQPPPSPFPVFKPPYYTSASPEESLREALEKGLKIPEIRPGLSL